MQILTSHNFIKFTILSVTFLHIIIFFNLKTVVQQFHYMLVQQLICTEFQINIALLICKYFFP